MQLLFVQNISPFLIAKIPRIIHHNQLLSTEFGKILRYVKLMTSIVQQICQIIEQLTEKTRGRG